MDNKEKSRAAIFVMPRSSTAWNGAEALWITVAGWSSAAEAKFGSAWVITSDRLATPNEVIHYPLGTRKAKQNRYGFLLPQVLKTFLKDIVLWKNRNKKRYETHMPWEGRDVAFVWEQHDLFCGPGKSIARALGVPFVIYVHAPVIWEASRWGLKRPVWGKVLEHVFEKRSLLAADVVACVSNGVKTKLLSMGIPEEKILVSPMSVDQRRFEATIVDRKLRIDLGLEGKFIIGWTGSFRGFHGLDILIHAFAKLATRVQNVTLLLIGDGMERVTLTKLVSDLGIEQYVKFTGKIPFTLIPAYVQLFDMAIVSAGTAENFHYSPLKLREYLVAKKPTLAPRVGEIPIIFEDKCDILMYDVSASGDLEKKMSEMVHNQSLREKLAENGYKKIIQSGTWDFELAKLMTKLKLTGVDEIH